MADHDVRKCTFYLALTLIVSISLCGQSVPGELLERAITQVRDTLDRLPRYVCTQTMDRIYLLGRSVNVRRPVNPTGCEWWPPPDHFRGSQSDRVRADVLSSDSGELYSWAGANNFDNPDLVQLVRIRPISSGDFSGLLRSVFAKDRVFPYLGEVDVQGRKLRAYSFRVPREESRYWFGTGSERRIVACEGTFLLDPDTADLVRLVVDSSEPAETTGACHATTTLSYGRTRLNESEFLLPWSTLFEFASTRGEETHNLSTFSGCHEFRADSTIRFDLTDPDPGVAANEPNRQVLRLPEGIPFRVAFTQDIDFRTAAVGDAIVAKTASPIISKSREVLVPAGAPVIARILNAELTRLAPDRLLRHLIFRLESVGIERTMRPFVATVAESARDCDALPGDYETKGYSSNVAAWLTQQNVGPLLLSPNTAILKFCRVKPDFVLKAGKVSKWKTGGTGPTPACLLGTGSC